MTPTLTDADRATIAAIESNWALLPADLSEAGAGYLAGLAAGMERAAKVCDANVGIGWQHPDWALEHCAAAIREQAKGD